uniref:Uncharacterized protein n=1 Tax=Rhizophora mucronata TaxID=61149 RepID=A0A2P2LB59_RHIMU
MKISDLFRCFFSMFISVYTSDLWFGFYVHDGLINLV